MYSKVTDMKTRFLALRPLYKGLLVVIPALSILLAFSLATPVQASAQPPFPIIYSGTATIAGEPAPDDTLITARVGGGREGTPGVVKDGQFKLLVADASFDYDNQEDAVGEIIEFFFKLSSDAVGIRAVETDVFEEGSFIEKTIDLNFPELPLTGDASFNSLWTLLGVIGASSLILGVFVLRFLPRLLKESR